MQIQSRRRLWLLCFSRNRSLIPHRKKTLLRQKQKINSISNSSSTSPNHKSINRRNLVRSCSRLFQSINSKKTWKPLREWWNLTNKKTPLVRRIRLGSPFKSNFALTFHPLKQGQFWPSSCPYRLERLSHLKLCETKTNSKLVFRLFLRLQPNCAHAPMNKLMNYTTLAWNKVWFDLKIIPVKISLFWFKYSHVPLVLGLPVYLSPSSTIHPDYWSKEILAWIFEVKELLIWISHLLYLPIDIKESVC